MVTPFKLRSTLSRNANGDRDDILRVKKALKRIGYFETPTYGLTEYPDEPLFKGIEKFQHDNGLRRDGVMKPGGETAKMLGQELSESGRRARREIHSPGKLGKLRSAFGLFDEFGTGRTNQARDVLSVKKALALMGDDPRDSTKALEGQVERELFDSVRRFQKKAGLKVDGWMRPYGETERELDRQLATRLSTTQGPEEPGDEGSKTDGEQQTAGVFIPPIVYLIAETYGIAVMAALVWWQSMSALERQKVRQRVEQGGPSDNTEDECRRLYYEVDIPTCNGISRRRGKRAAARCFASANERYAACRRGVPIDQLPPLDVWNN